MDFIIAVAVDRAVLRAPYLKPAPAIGRLRGARQNFAAILSPHRAESAREEAFDARPSSYD
jgi:hypothetical protein